MKNNAVIQLACKKLGLEYDEKYESEELIKEEQDYIMSDELKYVDFIKEMDSKSKIKTAKRHIIYQFSSGSKYFRYFENSKKNNDFVEYGNKNLEFFKRYLISKKDDYKFLALLDNYKQEIIKVLGYEYIFYTHYYDYDKMPNLIYLNLGCKFNINWASIAKSTSLQILYLNTTEIEDLTPLIPLKSLQTLDLGFNNRLTNLTVS